MATTTAVYLTISELQDWGWEEMEMTEVTHDSGEFDSVEIDFYPTGIRIIFANVPKDGRFELGDIEDIYSYRQGTGMTHSFLREVVECESKEDFYALLVGHCTDYHEATDY